jgi:dihydroxyacetone kinase
MSAKHFFPSTDGVVNLALASIAARNNHLELDAANKVLYNKAHSPSRITLISGGGSGHEPAWSGYVGNGMLTASVSGDVFASPSTKQIMGAVQNVPSDEGIILLITNYTGDQLHFGLAREKAAGLGYKVGCLSATDDVALGREKSKLVGRRGLAANLIVLKLVGAATQASWNFDQVLDLGRKANHQMVTVGTSLDHCHIPGRAQHEPVPQDTCVLGMGIHNEPGFKPISPIPSAEDLVKEMLTYLVDPNDEDRAFVKFKAGDEAAVMINNFGGLSNLEIEAITTITQNQLQKDWKIKPSRTYVGCFESSLNAPGFSISLGNISGISRSTQVEVTEFLSLLDAPTTAPAWPKNGYEQSKDDRRVGSQAQKREEQRSNQSGPQVSPQAFEKALRSACQKAVDAEPTITKYDLQMGDGDCGDAVAGACNTILEKLNKGELSSGGSVDVLKALENIVDGVEDVGGSLGAILSILLTAFVNALRHHYASSSSSKQLTIEAVSKSLAEAMRNLQQYTSARSGDRTVMDTLIPFTQRLQQTNELKDAVHAAETGAQKTAKMEPKFGRASYVGEKAKEEMPPDPGAYAVSIFLRGLLEGMQ